VTVANRQTYKHRYCENQGAGGGGGAHGAPHWQGERQFFWDFTNESLQEWWVDNMLVGVRTRLLCAIDTKTIRVFAKTGSGQT